MVFGLSDERCDAVPSPYFFYAIDFRVLYARGLFPVLTRALYALLDATPLRECELR